MHTVTAKLRSLSPYSASRPLKETKQPDESHEDFEGRVYLKKLHVSKTNTAVIPAMAFKYAMDSAGKHLGMKIKGKGNKTWTNIIKTGLLIPEPLDTGIDADTVVGDWQFVNANGKPGAGTRVWRRFPLITDWSGVLTIAVLNDEVLQKIEGKGKSALELHLETAGQYVGIGRFRVSTTGVYGRWEVEEFQVSK